MKQMTTVFHQQMMVVQDMKVSHSIRMVVEVVKVGVSVNHHVAVVVRVGTLKCVLAVVGAVVQMLTGTIHPIKHSQVCYHSGSHYQCI